MIEQSAFSTLTYSLVGNLRSLILETISETLARKKVPGVAF